MTKVDMNIEVDMSSPVLFPTTGTISSSPLSKAIPNTSSTTKKPSPSLSTLPLKTLRTSLLSSQISPFPAAAAALSPPRHSFSKITRDIVISDARTACSHIELRKLGITHVISVLGPSLRFRPKFPEWITSLEISIEDTPFEDLLSAVRKATAWMEEILGGCQAKNTIGAECQCFLPAAEEDETGGCGGGSQDETTEIASEFAINKNNKSKNNNRPRILVHCWQGVSRSPSIVAAYFIKTHSYSSSFDSQPHIHTPRMTAEKAIDFIRSKRPCVRPNQGFIRQLRQYEAIVKAECDMEDEWSTK